MKLKNKIKGALLLAVVPSILVACGDTEQREVIPIGEPEQEEDIDMEQFRVEGDRLAEEPVLSTEARQLRFIEQYERVDRPILVNTLRYLQAYDRDHAEAFDGVRLITSKSIDEVKADKLEEYREHLGEPLDSNTTQVFDIDVVYPYTQDDFKSYYQTVVNILKNEVVNRTSTYESISRNIEAQDFDQIRGSGIITSFQNSIDAEGGMVEQIRPYIQEMDKIVAGMRSERELDMPKYSRIGLETEELTLDKVEEFVAPKPMTVQEVIRIEPSMELYEDLPEVETEGEEVEGDIE